MDDFIDWNVFYFGHYCKAELEFLSIGARVMGGTAAGITYVDVGANVGHHALFMARLVSKVVAFEPSAAARQSFLGNIRDNGITNVQLFPVALGNDNCEAVLGSGLDGNSGSRSLRWTLDDNRNEIVEVRRGDDLWRDAGLSRIDIIKLDVEGYESRVLAGLRNRLLQDRPIVLMELLGEGSKGGFQDATELRQSIYPEHYLFTLRGSMKARLSKFDWNGGTAVFIPCECAKKFGGVLW